MKKENKKITSPVDLNAWKEARKLAIKIYKLTKSLPKEETYLLSDKIKRVAVSITTKVNERFSKNSYKDKQKISIDFLNKIKNQLLLERNIDYIAQKIFLQLDKKTILVHKLINELISPENNIIMHNIYNIHNTIYKNIFCSKMVLDILY